MTTPEPSPKTEAAAGGVEGAGSFFGLSVEGGEHAVRRLKPVTPKGWDHGVPPPEIMMSASPRG